MSAFGVLTESPSNIRAGQAAAAKSPGFERKSPLNRRKKNTNSLEDSLQALIASTLTINDGCKEATKDCGRIRRRSKECSETLGNMAEMASTLAGAAKIWQSLGPQEIDPSMLTDEALRKMFDEIDVDNSGTLEECELKLAIKQINPDATDDAIKMLMLQADTSGDGIITFDEYKVIMRAQTS